MVVAPTNGRVAGAYRPLATGHYYEELSFANIGFNGATNGNRTHVHTMARYCFTIKLPRHMVPSEGLEPTQDWVPGGF